MAIKPAFRCGITLKFFALAFFFISSLLALSGFSQAPKAPPKVKFKSMLMLKDTVLNLINRPKFDKFVFQCINVKTETKREVYELVVYAFDTDGKQLNADVKLLIRSKPPGITIEKEEDVNFANYTLTKADYDIIMQGVDMTKFYALKFEPRFNATHSFPNYVTYYVYPVDKHEVDISIDKLRDQNYLKPSPPAPPH